MPRKTILAGAMTLLVAGLLPALSPASAAPVTPSVQLKDDNRYVDLDAVDRNAPNYDPKSFKSVEPNSVTEANGRRVEVYGSVGDNEGGMDWRTVNEFAYLVNSVPKGSKSYTTLFNSLYDDRSISRVANPDIPGAYLWTVAQRGEVFSPTAAFLNQANLYDNEADRLANIHVLGARESIGEAFTENSSLARLVKAGYGSSSPKAVTYDECAGDGGCLSGPTHLMHSKYGAFEKAADSTGTIRDNVVWITSSNLNGSSGSKKANLSIAIFNDAKAFKAVKEGIFDPSVAVANKTKSVSQALDTPAYKAALAINPGTGVITGMPTDSGITLLPSPRRKTAASDHTDETDVEAAFLKQRTAVANKQNCQVYAVHSLFNSTRNGIREGLGDLVRQNCEVRVVLGENAIADLVDGYFNMSEDLRVLVGKVEFANVHDKTLSYKDNTAATSFGGASNFTGTSLEYDELAFRADNVAITDAVQQHSERIYQLARGSVKWAAPTSVSISPASALQVKIGSSPLSLSPRVSPDNALVTKTTWSASPGDAPNAGTASVDANGVVTGLTPGDAKITVRVEAPGTLGKATVFKTKTVVVKVVTAGTTTTGAGDSAVVPPTLTMDNYQGPGGDTHAVVTWGSGAKSYDGIVKLQYYSGGWKTYPKYITVVDGVGKLTTTMSSSKTWRAYGAVLTKVNGKAVPNSTAKTYSNGYSITTVRTKSASTTPRIYATSMAKSGQKIPFLISWNRGTGVFRLQMRSSGGSWKTHSTYRIPSGSSQLFIAVPALNTKYWRVATSTGSTKVSSSVKVSMK